MWLGGCEELGKETAGLYLPYPCVRGCRKMMMSVMVVLVVMMMAMLMLVTIMISTSTAQGAEE